MRKFVKLNSKVKSERGRTEQHSKTSITSSAFILPMIAKLLKVKLSATENSRKIHSEVLMQIVETLLSAFLCQRHRV